MKKYDSAAAMLPLRFKIFIGIELSLAAGFGVIWWQLCRKEEMRHRVLQRNPAVLDCFYRLHDQVAEEPGLLKMEDFEKWGVEE